MVMSSWRSSLVPIVAMVVVECLDVGLTTMTKAALSQGMSHFVFVVYSNALASSILLPYSLFFHRSKRPPLTLSLLSKLCILSFVGITLMQNCVFTGLSFSSPTLASAMGNLIPAFTFLLAVVFRFEKLDLRSSRSQVKILSTLVSISGALILTLYKGPTIGTPNQWLPSKSNLLAATSNWVIGGLFLATASLSAAIWNTSQAAILREYPSEITVVSLCCFFGTIQSTVVALVAEKDPNAWKLKPNIEIISVIYSAVCGSIVTYSVCVWCIHKKGPVFVAMFKPVGIAIAALMGFVFLGDALHLGSFIGAIIIVAGFYGVMWAQSKEEEETAKEEPQRRPILENHISV